MKFLVLLIFCATQSLGQEITCDYFLNQGKYGCNMTFNNPTGFDEFTEVTGVHLPGFTNDQVVDLFATSGVTANFPQIICQQFRNLEQAILSVPSLTTVSENAFRNCANLRAISIGFNMITLPANIFTGNPLLEAFVCERCPFNNLPPTIFQVNSQLSVFILFSPNLVRFEASWLNDKQNLDNFVFDGGRLVTELPRNSFNSRVLRQFVTHFNNLRSLDFFTFNTVEGLESLSLIDGPTPLESLDFNIFERANNLRTVNLRSGCTNLGTNDFNANREQNLALLEPCFAAFDARMIPIQTTGLTQTFNSIRQQRVFVRVQTWSDAIITFSNNPDGSGLNFEVHLGVNGNSRSELYQNGVLLVSVSTPGILNSANFVDIEISWFNDLIVVSQENPLFIHNFLNPFPVRFIGVGTRGFNAIWEVRQVV